MNIKPKSTVKSQIESIKKNSLFKDLSKVKQTQTTELKKIQGASARGGTTRYKGTPS